MPVSSRQLYYALRPIVQEEARPKNELMYGYFSQTLLPETVEDLGYSYDWNVTYDNRGHFWVPHRDGADMEKIGCGTSDVNRYLHDIQEHKVSDSLSEIADISIPTRYPTKGLVDRCSGVLFIEKEGFHPLFEHVKLCERYDLALISTKGTCVTAAKTLLDYLCGELEYPLYILHDFDAHGIQICKTTVSDTKRYEFAHDINYVDLGLRLDDVQQWNLAPESCKPPKIADSLLRDGWLSPEEHAFLMSGQRVELNAFDSPDFIKCIEAKLEANGVKKVVPKQDVLRDAYQKIWVAHKANRRLENLVEELTETVEEIRVPRDIVSEVTQRLNDNPEKPWDWAIKQILIEREDSEPDETYDDL